MRVWIAVLAIIFGGSLGWAQDDASVPEAAEVVAPDAASLPRDIDVDVLEAELRPLRAEQIKPLAEAWLGRLQEAVLGSSRLRVDEAPSDLRTEAIAEKDAILERFRVVVDAYKAKGGDAAEYEAFATAVSDVEIGIFDVGAIYNYAKGWVVKPEGGIAFGLAIVRFIVILIVFFIVSRAVGFAVNAAVKRTKGASELLRDFLSTTSRRVIMVIGIVVAVGELGVNVGPLVAAIGAAGLVVGFALQGTLSNFASGIMILIYKPFDIGNVVDAGGVSGEVLAMNLVSTKIKTFDNKLMIVPNNAIWGSVITNVTGQATRRVDLTFGISYKADMAKAEEILREVVSSHEKTLDDPAPTIKVHTLGDNSVNFICRPWSKTSDYWDVYWDITRKVKERFDEAGIGIPFPQRDMHIPDSVRVVLDGGNG
ncbi:MAG: mechanosensitive ion channel domain-containing protein [Planctomycetota bacterium]